MLRSICLCPGNLLGRCLGVRLTVRLLGLRRTATAFFLGLLPFDVRVGGSFGLGFGLGLGHCWRLGSIVSLGALWLVLRFASAFLWLLVAFVGCRGLVGSGSLRCSLTFGGGSLLLGLGGLLLGILALGRAFFLAARLVGDIGLRRCRMVAGLLVKYLIYQRFTIAGAVGFDSDRFGRYREGGIIHLKEFV